MVCENYLNTRCKQNGQILFVYDTAVTKTLNQNKAICKNIYKEIRSRYETARTAQAKFKDQFSITCLEWQGLIDSKSREFRTKS